MVVGFAMWSCGPPCRRCVSRAVVEPRGRRWAVRVLVAPFASLGDPRRVPGMPRRVGVGRSGRQWGGGKKEGRKRATTKVMARFRDAPAGPPISWVPPCVSPPYPLVERDCTGPHPSGEGRGGCGWMARVGSELGRWVVKDVARKSRIWKFRQFGSSSIRWHFLITQFAHTLAHVSMSSFSAHENDAPSTRTPTHPLLLR